MAVFTNARKSTLCVNTALLSEYTIIIDRRL